MPILRYRVALIALVAIFLIPVGTSSLSGLTHILTCRDPVRMPFSFVVSPVREPVLASSLTLAEGDTLELCDGLAVDLRARSEGNDRVALVIPIENRSRFPWRGTVLLDLDGTHIPVGIGGVRAGQTATDTVELRLSRGAHEVSGSLLIGP